MKTIALVWALITVHEDEFFAEQNLTMDNAASVIAGNMPEAACVLTSRTLNNYGAFTACVKRTK